MQELIKDLPYGDWPTYLWVLREGGKIKFLKDITAVYRKDFGTSILLRRTKSKIGEINLSILQQLSKQIDFYKQKIPIEKSIIKYKIGLMVSFNKEGRLIKGLFLFITLLKSLNPKELVRIYFYSLIKS